jgi:hypothetical protein
MTRFFRHETASKSSTSETGKNPMNKSIRLRARTGAVMAALAVFVPALSAHAASILELDRGAFGFGHLSDSTSVMNGQDVGGSTLGTLLTNDGNTITQTTSITTASLSGMDVVWVSLNVGSALTSSEQSVLNGFVMGGGKVVLIGESIANNDAFGDQAAYAAWDNSLLAVVGGAITAVTSAATFPAPVVSEILTAGLSNPNPPATNNSTVRFGSSSRLDTAAGSPHVLFDQAIAATYDIGLGQALVILDANWLTDSTMTGIYMADNMQFGQNISDWIQDSDVQTRDTAAAEVPEPGMIAIFGLGLLACTGTRRRRSSK